MPWLIVLSDAKAAAWVFDSQQMAFRTTHPADAIQDGDRFAIYISRSAHRNPTRDEGRIAAVGHFTSTVKPRRASANLPDYRFTCDLQITTAFPIREGVAFRPLVESLDFIRSKRGWPAYLRRTLVPIPDADFNRIERAVQREAAKR